MILVKRYEHLAVVSALSFCVQRLQQPVNPLLQFSGSGRCCHASVQLQGAASNDNSSQSPASTQACHMRQQLDIHWKRVQSMKTRIIRLGRCCSLEIQARPAGTICQTSATQLGDRPSVRLRTWQQMALS
jgi:hypothetical protein